MKKLILSVLAWTVALLVCGGCANMGGGQTQESSSMESSSVLESVSESIDGEQASDDEAEKEEYCLVQFDTDGAGDMEAVRVKKGEKISAPVTPQKTSKECEYEFLGWFFGENAWNFEEDAVTENMTLTAHWKEGNKYTAPFLPKN